MPAPDWDDLGAFLDVDDFAIEAVVTPQEGADFSVRGIFDDPYLNAQLGEYELDTTQPRLTCKESAVLGKVSRGDMVEIDGRAFDVLTEPQRDGTGMAVLMLAQRS